MDSEKYKAIARDPMSEAHSIDDVAAALAHAQSMVHQAGPGTQFAADAEMLPDVLQARATIKAQEANRQLVYATWALVAVTIVLAVVTWIVA